MTAEFEIVPNLSEGRDLAVVAACAAAMEAAGARVVDRTSDPIHHRSVITAVGSASDVVAAAVALAATARERIDLRRHRGEHPRIGALDVLPFVPLGTATLDDAVALARRIARTLRGSSGGLRTLQCLGLRLAGDRVQVSCNITDVDAVPLYRVTELVRRAAARAGVTVGRSELIGLAPRRAVERTARAYEAAVPRR